MVLFTNLLTIRREWFNSHIISNDGSNTIKSNLALPINMNTGVPCFNKLCPFSLLRLILSKPFQKTFLAGAIYIILIDILEDLVKFEGSFLACSNLSLCCFISFFIYSNFCYMIIAKRRYIVKERSYYRKKFFVVQTLFNVSSWIKYIMQPSNRNYLN